MRIRVVGSPHETFLATVRGMGFTLTDVAPEVIVAYGGDGTLIGAERDFPSVPKIGMRQDATCVKCPLHTDDVVLDRLRRGDVTEEKLVKLLGTHADAQMIAMNDIIFRNADPRAAVRFSVALDGVKVTEEMIGDGLIVATPFGSSAYFRSVTRMTIRTGIGLAFNNCTDLLHHLVVGENEIISVDLHRGPATLTSDNDRKSWSIKSGDQIVVKKAPGAARLLAVDTLRCAECRYVNAPRRRY